MTISTAEKEAWLDDVTLLRRAIAIATAGSARAYARTVADVSEVTVRRWLNGRLPLQGTARQLARAIVACPSVAERIRVEPR